jgi:hypothetical protein
VDFKDSAPAHVGRHFVRNLTSAATSRGKTSAWTLATPTVRASALIGWSLRPFQLNVDVIVTQGGAVLSAIRLAGTTPVVVG